MTVTQDNIHTSSLSRYLETPISSRLDNTSPKWGDVSKFETLQDNISKLQQNKRSKIKSLAAKSSPNSDWVLIWDVSFNSKLVVCLADLACQETAVIANLNTMG